ncbi:uncharacterized protein LOC114526207 [Dendronephthya gigantea]|uniref:uncharacterized protein LOC114526207 n=1 Tax=Dendronephthya gigantea TaxID=151771 RepID=UPI00106A76F7|nr:uncharacterized protein LOC114526207 [Dendronephthya gigantea]
MCFLILIGKWDIIKRFTEAYHHTHDIYKDILDGKLYQSQSTEVRRDGHFPITLYWHVDGAPAFRSNSASIWPIQSFVVELPPPLRYSFKNIIMSGIWYGKRKPNMEVFQQKFVEEMIHLGSGLTISIGDLESKFKLVVNGQVADLVAKAPSVNFIQFNGKFGCCSCLHPGQKMVGPGNKRVYPYTSTPFPRRTHEDTVAYAQIAEETGETVFGVKGRSNVHSILKIPDMLTFDYMHQVLEGEFTRRMTKWLSGSCPSRVNLKRTIAALSERLQSINLPHDFKRKFRSFEEFRRWKASEKQAFFLHASLPILKDILPSEVFFHFSLLVTGVRMLCEYNITEDMISVAGAMLDSYTRLLPKLYDISEATFNSHSLTHLAEQVRDHGPLILHSAFVFESMLAHLKRLFHGTRGVPDQICKKLAVAQHVEHKVTNSLKGNAHAREFADKLLRPDLLNDTIELLNNVHFFKPFKPLELTQENIEKFPHNTENMFVAQRMKKNGEVYHSTSYVRKKKSVSFLVKIKEADEYFGEVKFFVKKENTGFAVIRVYHSLNYNVCQEGLPQPTDPVLREFLHSGHLGSHFIAVEKTNLVKFVNCSSFIGKIILVERQNDSSFGFVSPVLKCYQHD